MKASQFTALEFTALAKFLGGNASVLVTSIKAFVAHPDAEKQAAVPIFAKPVLALIDALIAFSSADKFVGTFTAPFHGLSHDSPPWPRGLGSGLAAAPSDTRAAPYPCRLA